MPINDRALGLQKFHGITAGSTTASKALVVDSNKDISGIRNFSITGDLTVTGAITAGSVNGGTTETGTATATGSGTSGTATINKLSGIVTTNSMSVSSGGTYVLTLTNSKIAATDHVFASLQQNSLTGSVPVIPYVNPASGSADIIIYNVGSGTLSGAGKIHFYIVKV